MTRKTQRYSKEFRAEVIRTVLEQDLPIKAHRCYPSPKARWGSVTAARKGLVTTPGARSVVELEAEVLRLRNALNEAQIERDVLKKATAYFARESLKNTR